MYHVILARHILQASRYATLHNQWLDSEDQLTILLSERTRLMEELDVSEQDADVRTRALELSLEEANVRNICLLKYSAFATAALLCLCTDIAAML